MTTSWRIARLGDITEVITKGTTPTTAGYKYVDEGVNFVKVESISPSGEILPDMLAHIPDDCHQAFRRSQLKTGDILFSIAGALGRTAVVTGALLPANTNQALAIIRLSHSEDILPAYVLKALSSGFVIAQIEEQRGGVAQQNLSLSQLADFRIPIPPIGEQRRIVAILDEAFEAIATATANAEKNLANARELFDAELGRAFVTLAATCPSRKLADIVTRLTNGYVGPTRNIYLEAGVPYLLARHVRDNQLEFDGRTFVSAQFNEKNKKSKLKTGDVLLVQSGHIGHSAVVREDHEGHNCHAMIVITPISDHLSGDYLSLYFNSPPMKKKFGEIRSGSTVPHLTCGLVRELMIPLPTNAAQKLMVAKFGNLSDLTGELASCTEEKIQTYARLKQSLLQKAFAGGLTSLSSNALDVAAE